MNSTEDLKSDRFCQIHLRKYIPVVNNRQYFQYSKFYQQFMILTISMLGVVNARADSTATQEK